MGRAGLISELRNVLPGFVRRGAVTPDQAASMCADVLGAPGDRIAGVPGPRMIATALECGLPTRGAGFVVPARTLDALLAAMDRAILRSASDVERPPGSR